MTKILCKNNEATATCLDVYTSGQVGAEISFEFSEEWEGLTKTVVFSAGDVQRDVLMQEGEDTITIPWEVLQKAGEVLIAGVYGIRGSELVIPTVYCRLGRVQRGADPSGDPGIPPTPSILDQAIAAAAAALASAQEAAGSEGAALESAESAAVSAQGASNSATTAATHANNALVYKEAAEEAKDDAITAQEAAESAKSEAEEARDIAVQAKQDAMSSEENAGEYAENALLAKNDAVIAKNAAETAQEFAAGSAEDAEAWAVGKRGGVDVPATDPAYHNNSKYHADESKAAKQDIEDSIEGVAQEGTQQEVLAKVQAIAEKIDDGGGSSNLNGFGLKLGDGNTVVMTYTDPLTQAVVASTTLPSADTQAAMLKPLRQISRNIINFTEED